MKEIKVFLASSEEMKDDRLLFGDFIRKLNELFNKREKKNSSFGMGRFRCFL